MKRILLFLLIFLSSSLSLMADNAYTIETIPNTHLKNAKDFVSNPDGILSASSVAAINQILDSLQIKTTAEVAVVAVNSIGDEEIKPFATRLFEHWGIGKREKDNGLLILLVADKRQITFETGYGLEGVLPDAIVKRIQMVNMLPYFKKGDYSSGMLAGIERVTDILTNPEAADEIKATRPTEQYQGTNNINPLYFYLGASFLISVLLLSMIRSSLKQKYNNNNYNRYKSLVRFKGTVTILAFIFPFFVAFICFWLRWKLKKLRNEKQICDKCGSTMHKLNEEEDNHYLSPQENTEEKLNSVDYDVWLCDKCGNTRIFPYENAYTRYTVCPNCRARAYSLQKDYILSPATPFSAGEGEKIYGCAHCHKQFRKRYVIPMIIVASGGGHRGGGFGGGGGFSGGSFGGGRSGGGGATSGW